MRCWHGRAKSCPSADQRPRTPSPALSVEKLSRSCRNGAAKPKTWPLASLPLVWARGIRVSRTCVVQSFFFCKDHGQLSGGCGRGLKLGWPPKRSGNGLSPQNSVLLSRALTFGLLAFGRIGSNGLPPREPFGLDMRGEPVWRLGIAVGSLWITLSNDMYLLISGRLVCCG